MTIYLARCQDDQCGYEEEITEQELKTKLYCEKCNTHYTYDAIKEPEPEPPPPEPSPEHLILKEISTQLYTLNQKFDDQETKNAKAEKQKESKALLVERKHSFVSLIKKELEDPMHDYQLSSEYVHEHENLAWQVVNNALVKINHQAIEVYEIQQRYTKLQRDRGLL